jgi:hypothetical protein
MRNLQTDMSRQTGIFQVIPDQSASRTLKTSIISYSRPFTVYRATNKYLEATFLCSSRG